VKNTSIDEIEVPIHMSIKL